MPEDILEYGLKILKRRKVLYAERFAPYFFCSAGCHIFNLMNLQKKIYYENGKMPNLRMHVIFVAPPGYSKTFYAEQLADPEYGLFHDVSDWQGNVLLKTAFEQYMTEAGWVGSIEVNPAASKWKSDRANGDENGAQPAPIETLGMAWEFREGIVLIDEFAAVNAAISQKHSAALDTAILSSLDSGRVRKRLKAGPLSYKTNMTAWMGTQHARFDLSSGLGRRVFFITWVPTQEEQMAMLKAHWDGKNIVPQEEKLDKFKTMVAATMTEVDRIEKVEFADNFKDAFSSMGRPHYEITLFERLAIGWNVMKGNFDETLTVDMEEGNLHDLIVQGVRWRDRLMTESEGDQILQILKDHEGRMPEPELKVELRKFGVTYTHAEDLLTRLDRYGMIRRPLLQGGVRWVVRRESGVA